MTKKLELLKNVLYKLNKNGIFDELDADDIKVMIESLIIHWSLENELGIYTQGWGLFLEDINCFASEDENWFNKKFTEYIKKE